MKSDLEYFQQQRTSVRRDADALKLEILGWQQEYDYWRGFMRHHDRLRGTTGIDFTPEDDEILAFLIGEYDLFLNYNESTEEASSEQNPES